MTREMHDDERIFNDMAGKISKADLLKVRNVTLAWADALDKLGESTNVRIVFLACMNTIGTMGPAYCRLAAANLMARAKDYHEN
jgi:hypothetical protein